jgi:hypothetical protein
VAVVPVPKATMNEDDSLLSREYKIGLSRQRSDIRTETEAFGAKKIAQEGLWSGIHAPHGRHTTGALFACEDIGHGHGRRSGPFFIVAGCKGENMSAKALCKPNGYGVPDRLRDIMVRAMKDIVIRECLEARCLSKRNRAVLARMAVPTIRNTIAAPCQGGSGLVPCHAAINIGVPVVIASVALEP